MLLLVGCLLLVLLPFFGFAMVLALMLALLLGYSGVALSRRDGGCEARFGWRLDGPYAAALIGVVAIQIWSVISHFLAIGPGVLDVFANMFWGFGVRGAARGLGPGLRRRAPEPLRGADAVRAAAGGPGHGPAAASGACATAAICP